MPKNTIQTKKGNFGKVDKEIRNSIRTIKASGERNLDKELGIRGSEGLGSIKREKVKLGT